MKYCISTTNGRYPISEEEVPKVIMAMDKKGVVVLKSGVFSGAFISEITRDIHAEKGYNYGYTFKGDDGIDRKSYVTEIPEEMKEYKKLLDKNIKLLE